METGFNESRIISIGTAVPEYSMSQDTILQFMHKEYQDPTASRKLSVLFHQSAINSRHSSIPDFSDTDERSLFPLNHEIPMVAERIDVFRQKALPLSVKAIENAFKNIQVSVAEFGITHLITVTCTGILNPGLDIELMVELNLSPDTFHTSLNFIGCNAAFPALKIADSIVKSEPDARVLIVCVELCTLHFQPKNDSDNLLSNTIFGDGAAAVIMVSESFANEQNKKGFSLKGFSPILLKRGKDFMGWKVNSVNFEMILDAGIPEFIGEELGLLMEAVSDKLQLTPDNINHWAVHPGGKKILQAVERGLQLKDDELKHSYAVLRNYGNMSSPTILFVLNELFKSNPASGETIFAMGFGPGISIDTASMVCHGFV
ncbi:type III polyketide synthase [Williamwhitmania taraxaci]|uniref:Predicted naringenin-chalcone synthase n=1 Tax=Williamwhitmania taraxaci TaxID=1640674 RepID=A0A1G6SUM2_9BACT|nr:type III polyketide synthase [Williamwhitmania taraxaci]SDD19976.1 Predicted naringenin-chalcone synthase [Williamwhitmania taraxaci]